MHVKTFEVRDAATLMPVLAVKLDPGNARDAFLLARSGFGTTPEAQGEYVMLWPMDGGVGKASTDQFEWTGSRTMFYAHEWIMHRFDQLDSGSVVDVEHIIGERAEPKASESGL